MVRYGITDDGFTKKSFPVILQNLEDNAKRLFGENVDLTPGSPLKLMIDLMATELVELWNQTNSCYLSGFVDTSAGASLDSLTKLAGITRQSGSTASGTVTFFRTTPLSGSTAKIIPENTVVTTADISPKRYLTTQTVYFQPSITDEEYTTTEDTSSYDCENYIDSVTSVIDEDSNDYTSEVSFDGRTITLDSSTIPSGKTVYTSYVPLSVDAPIRAVNIGESGNTSATSITVMSNPFDFVHYIQNESALTNGTDEETDSELRARIISARESFGKGTEAAIEYNIKQVSDVSNVKIYNPYFENSTEDLTSDGSTTLFTSNTPIYRVNSVSGYTVDYFDADAGEIVLTSSPTDGESVSVDYDYYIPGKIKIYVAGGTVGDEDTEDTIVYAIEKSKAAGVHSIGYGTGDTNAVGSDSAPFAWFYRPNDANIDVTVTVYFDADSDLTTAEKNDVADNIESSYATYINNIDMNGRVYRNRLIKKALETHADIIDVTFDSWQYNGGSVSVDDSYIEVESVELPVANNITVNTTMES